MEFYRKGHKFQPAISPVAAPQEWELCRPAMKVVAGAEGPVSESLQARKRWLGGSFTPHGPLCHPPERSNEPEGVSSDDDHMHFAWIPHVRAEPLVLKDAGPGDRERDAGARPHASSPAAMSAVSEGEVPRHHFSLYRRGPLAGRAHFQTEPR